MYLSSMPKYDFLSSKFTRKKGFLGIESSISISRKKAINMLNSFTPQGASPDSCVRIAVHDNLLGVGFYNMQNASTASIKTMFFNFSNKELMYFNPLTSLDISNEIIDKVDFNENKYFEKFSTEDLSSIIYSALCGDNIIIVDRLHENRLKFLSILLSILPGINFSYNRYTSSCYDLDGNENIIGVPKLPNKFRSHKKLYLPLDTIFVDLENLTVEGSGMKNSNFTRKIIENKHNNINFMRDEILVFYTNIINKSYANENYDETTLSLISRIEIKLGLRKDKIDNWIMDF